MDMTHDFPPLPMLERPTAARNERLANEIRRALIVVGGLVASLGLAASVIPIGGAVVAPGHIGLEGRVKRVTHPDGGVIAQILVRNGDPVRAGQPLIRFEDKALGNDAEVSQLSVVQLLAQKARLEAEELGLPRVRFPAELANSTDPDAKGAMEEEQRRFALQGSEQGGLRAQLQSRIVQTERQIAGYEMQISALRRQSGLIVPELSAVRSLWDKGLVTVRRKNELERSAIDIESNIGSLEASIAQARAKITETREQSLQMAQSRRVDAGTQWATVNSTLNQQKIHSAAADLAQDRTVVRAAYAGIVDKLAFAARGDVVRAAEPIMEIVPEDDELIVEAMVSPNDIGEVLVGQKARIRMTAMHSTATPELTGKIITVAADPSTSEDGKNRFFPIRVRIDPSSLTQLGGARLRSGMPAEIFAETGDRSMISYLTKPLRDQIARAFRDQ